MNTPHAAPVPQVPATMRRKVLVNFGLFAVFFLFYLGAAVIQTPVFRAVAELPVLGIPFGLLASLAVFPVSWIIMVIWFLKAR
jgi:hypothetical protein